MLTVAESAARALHEFLDKKQARPEQAVRLSRTQGQHFAAEIDIEHDDDVIVQHMGRDILTLEPKVADDLEAATVDVVLTPSGPQIALRIPEQREEEETS